MLFSSYILNALLDINFQKETLIEFKSLEDVVNANAILCLDYTGQIKLSDLESDSNLKSLIERSVVCKK